MKTQRFISPFGDAASIKSNGITHAISEQTIEPKGNNPKFLNGLKLLLFELRSSTQSREETWRTEAALELLTSKLSTKSNQEGFAKTSSPKAKERLMQVRVESTL